jgi:four helix bundle protein
MKENLLLDKSFAFAEEAAGAQSRNDFISKLAIVYKEARETKYWIRLLREWFLGWSAVRASAKRY